MHRCTMHKQHAAYLTINSVEKDSNDTLLIDQNPCILHWSHRCYSAKKHFGHSEL